MTAMKQKLGFVFSKQQLLEFFLLIAFPIHFWAWIIWFQEFETLAQRTNVSDAIGAGSYFMVYAFYESAVIFAVLSLLMLLLPRNLKKQTVFVIIGSLYLIISGWFILEQVRFLAIIPDDVWFFKRVQNLRSIQTKAGLVTAATFTLTLILPPFLLIRNSNLQEKVYDFLSRLTTLSILYLIVDLAAVIVIIIRNI